MNIKSSQVLVEEAKKSIETLSSEDVKKLYDQGEITLIDVRDISEIWKEGTIEHSKYDPNFTPPVGKKKPTILARGKMPGARKRWQDYINGKGSGKS